LQESSLTSLLAGARLCVQRKAQFSRYQKRQQKQWLPARRQAVPEKITTPANKRITHPAQSQAADSPMLPDVGTQAQFKKRKPLKTYSYDTSLDLALSWDASNGNRGLGEWLLARVTETASLWAIA
jgi:hypothetical protein